MTDRRRQRQFAVQFLANLGIRQVADPLLPLAGGRFADL
jgi:hypothetical protein